MKIFKEYILTQEIFYNLLIFLIWGGLLLAYFRGFWGFLPIIGKFQYEAEAVLVTTIVILGLPAVINRMTAIDWCFLLCALCIYILNIGFYYNNYDVLLENIFPTLCLTIPYFIIGRQLNIKKYLTPMITISTICIAMDALYFLMYMRNPEKMIERMAGEYYMYQAYKLLPHVMLMSWRGIKEFCWWKLCIAILGMFLIMAYGTRGPLACLFVFCSCYFFFYTKFRSALWVKGILIAISGILFLFQKGILLFLQEMLSSLDMSTRIIDRMLAGGLLHDTGRGFIKLKLYEYLDRPDTFWGYGLFGCSRFGMKYPHDFILDFFFSFGYFLGSIFILLIISIVIKAHLLAKNRTQREFILMLVCMTLLKYFFSSTFINEGFFFMLIGYCTTIIIQNYYEKQNCNCIGSL